MAEILTESFCERCGTRYTFESPRPRRLGVGRIRTLTRGVRNFVVNDSSSFADAMAAARDDESRVASQRQLDAFHETFNFCMGCRQYTCRNCWNERAGECLSCAPDLSLKVVPAEIQGLAPVATTDTAQGNGAEPAWPTADVLRSDTVITSAAEWLAPIGAPEPEAEAAAPELALTAAAPEVPPGPTAIAPEIAPESTAAAPEVPPEAAEAIAPEPEAETAAPELALTAIPPDIELTSEELAAIQGALARHVPGPGETRSVASAQVVGGSAPTEHAPGTGAASEPARAATASSLPAEPVANARAATRSLLRRFRPRSERAMPTATPLASEDLAPAASPAKELAPQAELAPAAAPGPGAAADLLRPAAVEAAAPLPEPAAAAAPTEAAPATPPGDHVAQPIWRIVAPESGTPAEPPPTPGRWIAPPAGGRRSADAVPSAPWAARVATARPLESPVWAASSNDILAAGSPGAARPVSIQTCVTCGLSLSANARFCRRCGSRQG